MPHGGFHPILSPEDTEQGGHPIFIAVWLCRETPHCRASEETQTQPVSVSGENRGGAALLARNRHFQFARLAPSTFNYSRFGDFYLDFRRFVKLPEFDRRMQSAGC